MLPSLSDFREEKYQHFEDSANVVAAVWVRNLQTERFGLPEVGTAEHMPQMRELSQIH